MSKPPRGRKEPWAKCAISTITPSKTSGIDLKRLCSASSSYARVDSSKLTSRQAAPSATLDVGPAAMPLSSLAGDTAFLLLMSHGILLLALSERDPEAHDNVITVAAETSELPQYRDATDHLHLVIRRRGLVINRGRVDEDT